MALTERVATREQRSSADVIGTVGTWRPSATYLQESWFHATLRKRSADSIVVAWEIRGPLDLDALEKTVDALVARHNLLRTTLDTEGSHVCQLIGRGDATVLRRVDLSRLPSPLDEVTKLIATEGQHEFSFTDGPLWQPWIVRTGDSHHVMINVFSHIISDSWSIAVAFRDLTRLYQHFATGEPPRLPEMELQFGDYATWERNLSHVSHEAWWQGYLGSPDTLHLPARPGWTDHSVYDTATQVATPAVPAVTARLAKVARDHGVSVAGLVSVGVAAALSRYAGERVVLGFMYANRERSSVQSLFGPLFDYLPVVVDLSGNPSFVDLLRRWPQSFREAMAHRLPLGLIEKCCGEVGSRTDLFDVAVDFLPTAQSATGAIRLADGQVTTFSPFPIPFTPVRDRSRRFVLSIPITYVIVQAADNGFRMLSRANLTALSEDTVTSLGADLAATLCHVSESPTRPIRDLSVAR
jgi:hypothetical protein